MTAAQNQAIRDIILASGNSELVFRSVAAYGPGMGEMIVRTSRGTITMIVSSAAFKALTAGSNIAGTAGAAIGVFEDIHSYNDGGISGERLSYRLTGTAAVVAAPFLVEAIIGGASAGPIGVVTAIAIGGTFSVGEWFWDDVLGPAIDVLNQGLDGLENGLRSGWYPG